MDNRFQKKEEGFYSKFFTAFLAVIAVVLILGILNQFIGWAFDWKVTF